MVSMLPGVLSWQFLNVNLALWHPYVEPVQVAGCPGDIWVQGCILQDGSDHGGVPSCSDFDVAITEVPTITLSIC